MTLPVVVRLEAQAELVEAWGWYETQRSGLGDELLGCLEAAIGRAARDPTLHAITHGDVRRVLVRRFPYAVFYAVEGAQIIVLAIAHVRREPLYWLDRVAVPSIRT